VSPLVGTKLAELYASREALLPGDGSFNSNSFADVAELVGRKHLANEHWYVVSAVPAQCGQM
jgi:hypothetical protein